MDGSRTVWSPMFVVLLKSAYVIYTSDYDSFASDKNVNGIYELCEGVKQQGGSLEEYYSYVKRRWEELGLYQPYPEDIDTWQRLREQLKVSSKHQFLTVADLRSLSAFFSRLSRIS